MHDMNYPVIILNLRIATQDFKTKKLLIFVIKL